MDKEGLEIYKTIKKLKIASSDEVMMMQQFTKKYIDPKCVICQTCPAQIRFAYNRIINWGVKNEIENINYELTDNEEVIEEIVEIEKVDGDNEEVIEEKEKVDEDNVGGNEEVIEENKENKESIEEIIGGENDDKPRCECGSELPDKRFRKCKICKRKKK